MLRITSVDPRTFRVRHDPRTASAVATAVSCRGMARSPRGPLGTSAVQARRGSSGRRTGVAAPSSSMRQNSFLRGRCIQPLLIQLPRRRPRAGLTAVRGLLGRRFCSASGAGSCVPVCTLELPRRQRTSWLRVTQRLRQTAEVGIGVPHVRFGIGGTWIVRLAHPLVHTGAESVLTFA
jgi:hypothetical protein